MSSVGGQFPLQGCELLCENEIAKHAQRHFLKFCRTWYGKRGQA
jgi:hypothetical protein